jgi:hypothetical protein
MAAADGGTCRDEPLVDLDQGAAMRQSRLMSSVEAVVNVLVGFGLAVLTQVLVFPLFGLHASLGEKVGIGAMFTVVSLVRSYMLRRLFERGR